MFYSYVEYIIGQATLYMFLNLYLPHLVSIYQGKMLIFNKKFTPWMVNDFVTNIFI